MKKIFLLSATIIIFCSGCKLAFWQDTPSLEERIENANIESPTTPLENTREEKPKIIIAKGYITPNLNRSFFDEATHLLQNKDAKTLFLLKSDVENLEKYEGEGKVEVKGEKSSLQDSELDLIHLHTVHFLETPLSEKSTILSSNELGLQLLLPPKWVFTQDTERTLLFSSKKEKDPAISIEKFPLSSESGTTFAAEMAKGTEISVGEKRAFRFSRDNNRTDIFVLYKEDIVLFQFLGAEERKVNFYDILLSVEFLEETTIPEICGGIAGFQCPLGYRCELDGGYPDASGKCVLAQNVTPTEIVAAQKIDSEQQETQNTEDKNALASTPENNTGKNNPEIAAQVIQEEENPRVAAIPEETAKEEEQLVMEYIRTHIQTLAPEQSNSGRWEVTLFAFSEGNLVSAEYANTNNEQEKRKLLFEFAVENRNVSLTEQAYFIPGEESDWKRSSGEGTQTDKQQEVFTAEGEKKGVISEGFRLYESTHYNFQVEYPQNYYYAHVGGADESISTVVFSNSPANLENARITLQIKKGEQKEKVYISPREILLPRDQSSHFSLLGSPDEEIISVEHMAETLVITAE